MLSLQTLAIKSIIKNDVAIPKWQYYLQRLIVEFCEKHPEQVPNSPQSYWKLRSSYLFLSERTIECKYFGPGHIYSWDDISTFLNDPTNLTTKFINSELQKHVDLTKSHFISRELPMPGTVPYKAYFEFTPEYIKHTGSKYAELGLHTTIMSTSTTRYNECIKHLSYNMSYHFKNDVFADHIYSYKPITYICKKETTKSVLHTITAIASYKNNPIFVFNDELRFIDECANSQRDCQHIFTPLMERINWFRSTIHSQFMSELHFMLLDCDITHRVLNIMTLFPTVFFKVRDELLDEVQTDEA
jgi:hypothetical protein